MKVAILSTCDDVSAHNESSVAGGGSLRVGGRGSVGGDRRRADCSLSRVPLSRPDHYKSELKSKNLIASWILDNTPELQSMGGTKTHNILSYNNSCGKSVKSRAYCRMLRLTKIPESKSLSSVS